jgi:GNAT superfamily N-acetyltransferase
MSVQRPKAKRVKPVRSIGIRGFCIGKRTINEKAIRRLIERNATVNLEEIRFLKAGRKIFVHAIFEYGIQSFHLLAGNRLIRAGGSSPAFFARSIESEFRGYGLGRIALETHFDMARESGAKKVYHGTKKKSAALLFLSAGMEIVNEKRIFEYYGVKSRQELVAKLREMKAKKGEADVEIPCSIGFEKILN